MGTITICPLAVSGAFSPPAVTGMVITRNKVQLVPVGLSDGGHVLEDTTTFDIGRILLPDERPFDTAHQVRARFGPPATLLALIVRAGARRCGGRLMNRISVRQPGVFEADAHTTEHLRTTLTLSVA